jgi:streptogramin lyase
VSAVDPRTERVTRTVVPGVFPSDLAAGAGSVWVLDGHAGVLVRVDPAYGRVAGRLALPRSGGARAPADRFTADATSVAVGAGGVWVTDGSRRLLRVDPATGRLAGSIRARDPLGDVAVGAGAVWAISGPGAAVVRVDATAGRVTDTIPIASRPGAESPYPVAVAADDRFVWVLSANTASLTKIDARGRGVVGTTRIGVDRDPVQVAAGAGAAWVADGDGTLVRVDATTGAVRSIAVGRGLRDVGVGTGRVWVTNQETRCCGQE